VTPAEAKLVARQLRISQHRLAKACGVTRKTINTYFNGRDGIATRPETVQAIKAYLSEQLRD
jgi:transcriptional regulator with XRE-family HTH domain